MTDRPAASSPLDTSPAPVQTRLVAAWTSLMFIIVYVDIFNFYKPGVIDGIRSGLIWEFDVSPTLLTALLAAMIVPSVMMLASAALPARANRITNLVVATLLIPYCAFNAAGATAEWVPFYVLSIGVEVLILVFILRAAWRWPRAVTAPASPEASSARASVRR